MITVAVCEDETSFVEILKNLLEAYFIKKNIQSQINTFQNGEALIHSGQDFNIILMDIKLPGQDGTKIMHTLRTHGNNSQLIFITAYPQYVFQSFDLDAIHYLLKPITSEKLFPALDKALKRIIPANGKTFFLEKGTSIIRIPMKDILFCEALNHQITIHCISNKYQFIGALDALQEKLDERFYRCHRSYLVNLDAVTELQTGTAILSNGAQVFISRRRQQEFMQRLLYSCRKELP